jgi:hypothetical protein
MIDQIEDSRIMIDVSMSRSGRGRQFTIGWGAGLTYMTGLVGVSVISQETRKRLKRWQTHRSPMSSYFAEIPTSIAWNQRKFVVSQFGRQNFPNGVPKG